MSMGDAARAKLMSRGRGPATQEFNKDGKAPYNSAEGTTSSAPADPNRMPPTSIKPAMVAGMGSTSPVTKEMPVSSKRSMDRGRSLQHAAAMALARRRTKRAK